MSLRGIDFAMNQKETTIDPVEEAVIQHIFIGNIPDKFKSADMRYFFKKSIEESAFNCFHYRHRPEKQVVFDKDNEKDISKSQQKTCCCVVSIKKLFAEEFIKAYHNKEWRSRNLKFHGKLANIQKIALKDNCDVPNRYKSKGELKIDKHITDQEIYKEDISTMIEMNPPDIMPNGNVGTPTKYFHQLIRECKLPSSVIKNLGLEFPKSKTCHYSTVPLNYDKKDKRNHGDNSRLDSDHLNLKNSVRFGDLNSPSHAKEDDELDEDHDAEDWDRYEALHDDVDNQGRPKERLFEEDIELKWEKGGSGLVFYTDSYFWNEMKGKDFDEDTVDDWDVDYSIYYEDGAGDKAARDQLQMRIEERRRKGKNDGPIKYSEIRRKEKQNREEKMRKFGDFEKYSKGFGSRILKKQGWKEGDGIGVSTNKGISEPLELEGQSSKIRSGLGYFGEKLDRSLTLKRKAERDVYISTIYDDQDGEELDAMRYHGKELLKYRPVTVKFQSEKS